MYALSMDTQVMHYYSNDVFQSTKQIVSKMARRHCSGLEPCMHIHESRGLTLMQLTRAY
jgi:hypothetical protein